VDNHNNTELETPTPKSKSVKPLVQTPIEIAPPDIRIIQITVVGDSPLICHRWSEKAKKSMLDKQMKKARTAKQAKDPEEDYRQSLYHYEGGGYGFPAVGLKSSAVDACSQVDGITKVNARAAFHIIGELVKIDGEPGPREDMVRIAMGTADIRYRGEFKQWSATFQIRYNHNVLSPEQIVNLFNTAGFGVGIGEWRPQKDGSFGMFHVA
jgi:hypothetical protein